MKNYLILPLVLLLIVANVYAQTFPQVRIGKADRNFVSEPIEAKIIELQTKIKDKELAWLFGNCFPNTLDRTVKFSYTNGKPNTFVITGDINAMWLRDCSAQVWPYLSFMKDDKQLQQLIAGVINRQAASVLIDPYANAFNFGNEGSQWDKDLTKMLPQLHERKWEVDGLCYVIRLSYRYWKLTGDSSCFGGDWQKAMALIVKTFKEQQRIADKGPYTFQRKAVRPTDTQFGRGYGNPVRPTGLICSMFRPSDDATIYPYLIPSNCFAVVSLRQLAEMENALLQNTAFAKECTNLANEVDAAIKKYAVVQHPAYGSILAFEVDGYGNYLMMDDSNVPSLLSLPYLGYMPAGDKLYQNTRRFVCSPDNPYFFKGSYAEGIGGPHAGADMIWPMAIIMKAITSNNKSEIAACLKFLKTTHANTGFMHESFNKDDPAKYTRAWFAWANTLFGELILKIEKDFPDLLNRNYL